MNKSFEVQLVNKWLQKNRQVWVKAIPDYPNPDEDAFLEGKVIDILDKEVRVELTDSLVQVQASKENVLKLTYGPADVGDMVDLQQLNEPELLYNVKRRYINDQIFTYCGPTLVIINPYAYIDKLFNEALLQEYQTMVFTDNLEYKSMPPHVFALAAFCLWQLFDNERNQSIVISGESGAGKTENTKYCLKFLASLGRNMKELVSDPQKPSGGSSRKINYQNMRTVEKTIKRTNSKVFGIEEKILGCNEILQAFGNSKTIRNDNSSRFGKLILLLYGDTQIDIKSAFIISYLLEKSRIVTVSEGERNYHIFYYFCKGTTVEQKQQYRLRDPITNYFYLNQSSVYDLPKSSDEQKFAELKKEFSLYLVPEETDCVFRVLSCVLNIGNIVFKKGENKNNEEIVTITNEEYIRNVTDLLEVDYEEFKHCFEYKTRKTGANVMVSPLKYAEAMALRDSFSKNIYEKIFNYLVMKLNEKIQIEKFEFDGGELKQKRKSIGLLDIFGFEVLGINSLEQFFINFANEKLQQLYVSYIFKEEQNEFLREGLREFQHDIGFQDNKPIIDLFDSYPLGIFSLINESSQLNKPDEDLPDVIIKNHKNPIVSVPKSKKNHFIINHSCSAVTYNTIGFTAKNKDEFPRQLLQVIKKTKNEFLRKIVMNAQKQDEGKAKKPSFKFLGSKFLSEMNKLKDELQKCDCHFVRCIKPNSKKAPRLFNSDAVLQSLRYLGVLDSIKIRKLGFIYRRPYRQFFKKFYEIERYIYSYQDDIQGKSEQDFKEECRRIIEKIAKKQLEDNDILFGSTKILIKESALNHLELLAKQKRRLRVQTANRVKNMYKNSVFRVMVKSWLARIRVMKSCLHSMVSIVRQNILSRKVLKVQGVVRKYLWHLRLEKIKEEATKLVTKLSAHWKSKKQRKWFLQLRQNLLKLQANIRTYVSMNKYFKEKLCLSIIKSIYNRSWEMVEQKKVRLIQRSWRGSKTRKQLKQLLRMMKMRAFVKRVIIKTRLVGMSEFLKKHKDPIMRLQAIVKIRYLRRTFLKVKRSAIIIQKAYRRHLHKRYYLEKIWEKQKEKLITGEREKYIELTKLGYTNLLQDSQRPVKLIHTSGAMQKLSPAELSNHFINSPPVVERDMVVNETIYFPEKNSIQAYIADMDILLTASYRGKWVSKYSSVKNELIKRQQYPLKIEVSEYLTCVVSNKDRIYTFGDQDDNEDADFCKTDIKTIPHMLSVNDYCVHVVTRDQELYEWGDNKNGELFAETQDKTVRVNYHSSVASAMQVEVRGANRYYVDGQGRAYGKTEAAGIRLVSFNAKVQISAVCASLSFTHFLTATGQLYSMGCNRNSQLGLDSTSKLISSPTLNQFFLIKRQIIESVSSGLGHTVVKTKLGYAYAWGDNRSSQVAHHPQQCITMPTAIEDNKQKLKVLQAVAGIRCTYLLMDSLAVLALGVSSKFDTGKTQCMAQVDLLYTTNSNPKNLVPLRLACSWNRQMSVLTVNCLEQNKCKPGTKPDVVYKYCKLIARDWGERLVYPQYAEWMDNILNISDMRRFKFPKVVKPKPTGAITPAPDSSGESELDELKILMELRKTSSLFKNEARNKVEQILKRLASKPAGSWTREEGELNAYIKQSCRVLLK